MGSTFKEQNKEILSSLIPDSVLLAHGCWLILSSPFYLFALMSYVRMFRNMEINSKNKKQIP